MLNQPKSNPIKILHIITKSNYGGGQKYVLELAIAAKEAGHNVSVACGGTGYAGAPTGELVEKLNSSSIKVLPVKNFMRDMSLFRDMKAFFEILSLLTKEKPDVIHVTSSKAGGIGALAGRLARVPNIVFTSHGLTMDEIWRPNWQRVLIFIASWLTIKLSHRTIMISTDTYERVRKMPGLANKVFLVKNGISPTTLLDKSKARTELAPDVPQSSFWIGGIGELHPNKNWASAILAMTTLPKKTHLIIIGEGEERERLERLISDEGLQNRVHLLGFVTEPSRYLKALDIFILPSKKEGLPYVLMESGLAALPTVASDLPGNRDIITTGETGFLIEPSPKLISTTLEMLVRDEGMRRQLGENLNNVIKKDFSIKRMADQTIAFYDSKSS